MCRASWLCTLAGSIMLLRTCKLLSIQQSKKAMFPNVTVSLRLLQMSPVAHVVAFMHAALSSSVACFPAGRRSRLLFEGSFGTKSEERGKEQKKRIGISLKYCWRGAAPSFNWGWDGSVVENVPEGHRGSPAAGRWWRHPAGLSSPPHCAGTRLQHREIHSSQIQVIANPESKHTIHTVWTKREEINLKLKREWMHKNKKIIVVSTRLIKKKKKKKRKIKDKISNILIAMTVNYCCS